jgi:type I restriction enzyme R subunit
MSRLTESAIEDFAIKLFERLGYDYVYAPDVAPDGELPERSHYGDTLLPKLMSGEARVVLDA